MAADSRHKPATSDFPLHAFEICRSTDFEEVRALVRAEFDLDVVPTARGDTATDAVISCLNLPGLSLTYVHYGPPVEVRVRQPGRNYNVVLPLAGRVERDYADETQVCVPTRTSLRSPCRFMRTRFSAGARRVNLAIGRDTMVRRLSTLMGEGVYDDLVFERRLDLAHGFGASLRSYLFWAMGEFDRGAAWVNDDHMIAQVEDWIFSALLFSQPHNYTERLDRDRSRPAPKGVKRAVDFIHAHPERPLRLEDLVAVSGVPGRTLRKHFRDTFGVPPMAYLRKVRFERARRDLLDAAPGDTVADVAWRWGIRHMGRFSVDYRRLFGETPSQTARRRGRP